MSVVAKAKRFLATSFHEVPLAKKILRWGSNSRWMRAAFEFDFATPLTNSSPSSKSTSSHSKARASSTVLESILSSNEEKLKRLENEVELLRSHVSIGLQDLLCAKKPYLSDAIPCRILGGISMNSFQALYFWRNANLCVHEPPMQVNELMELKTLNAVLVDQNEDLEDLVRDLTLFVENQKDTIENLKNRLRREI